MLPSIQVSNYLRSLTYALPSGRHTLWLSELPYGFPFILQRIDCYTMEVNLAPASHYTLRLDPKARLPLLLRSETLEIEAVGRVVDRPVLAERGCRW